MTRPLKVWGGHLHLYGVYGQQHAIVAATSKTAAAEALGVSMYYLNGWCSETGNDEEIAVATAEPGTVFYRGMNDVDGPWARAEAQRR